MTREEQLYSMRTQELVIVANKLGIKIDTKADKSKVIETILVVEAQVERESKNNAKEI